MKRFTKIILLGIFFENLGVILEDIMEQLTSNIIGAAIEVHKALGPGLLESTYETCLMYELNKRNLKFERQKALPVFYKGINLDCGYRIDLLVEGKVIVELKAVECITSLHKAQIMSYLKLSNCQIALLINFNVEWLKDGIFRIVNEF
jgi:GxxExxY protein